MTSRSDDDDTGRLWASKVSLFNSREATRRSAKELAGRGSLAGMDCRSTAQSS